MITINEKTAIKVTGVTSLYITTPYNKQVIDTIKASGVAVYDNSTQQWECPLVSLSFLLDNLTYFDDIKLILKPEEIQKPQVKPILTYKTKPFPYQIEGIEYGLNHNKWLLLDEPGLGKTLQLIYLAEELKAQKHIQHCLIVCGINTLKSNWEKEIHKHSDETCIVLGKQISKKGRVSYSSITDRINQLLNPIKEFFIITNIETLRNDNIIKALQNTPNKIDAIWFDECHKAKGWGSHQGINLMKLEATYMVAATGTLLMNNPLDAYVPLVFIDKEPKRSVTKYKQTYCVFDNNILGRIIGYQNLDLLKEEIESCSLRRKRDILNSNNNTKLPPRTIIDTFVDMEDKHRKFYNNIEKGVKEEADKINLKPDNLLAMTTRLRQATSCPSSLTTENIVSSKVEYAVDLTEELISNGDKVVIFSSFKEPIIQLQQLLKEYNPLIGTGDMKDSDFSNNIDLFQTNPKYKVFLGTISKMGTGITLTASSSVIFIDEPFTEAAYEQAADRVYRIGQTKPVFVYNLICQDTIDVVVSNIIKRKKAISDFVIDNTVEESNIDLLKQYIQDL
jgi:SNF2 family DNA or RNA helicase